MIINYENYDEMKKYLTFKLFNLKNNIYDLTVHKCPYEPIANYDLAYCITLSIDNGDDVITSIVNHDMLRKWGILYKDAYPIAVENFRKSKTKVLRAFDFDILTNTNGINGAVRIFDHKALYEILENDIYENGKCFLIPSSIHEWIVYPYSMNTDARSLNNIIRSVNDDVVIENERLSNYVYMFDGIQKIFYKYSNEGFSERIFIPDFSKR